MIKNAQEPARKTDIVRSELQATSDLRANVLRQRSELDADLDAAVAACVRAGSTVPYEKVHQRTAALLDLAGKLAEREAVLNSELRNAEAWDRAAPERAKKAAAVAEAKRITGRADNATSIVEAFLSDADRGDHGWRTRGHNPCPPADVAKLPGVRRGEADEPFAVATDRGLLEQTLKKHKDTLVRGGVPAVLNITMARPITVFGLQSGQRIQHTDR